MRHLDARRVHPLEDTNAVAARVAALAERLTADGPEPLFVIGAGYDPMQLELELGETRAPQVLWLWWHGPGAPNLAVVWWAYVRRFDLEHTFHFVKQILNWTVPRVRSPQQADRWTWLAVAAHTELRLARSLVHDRRLPSERPIPAATLTPHRRRSDPWRIRAGSPPIAQTAIV